MEVSMKIHKIPFVIFFLIFLLCLTQTHRTVNAKTEKIPDSSPSITAKAAVLMDGKTGRILYEKSPDTQLVPASITKIMTLLLIFEALDTNQIHLNDQVSVSETAANMGGSQVFLEPLETQTVEDMIKCICIASANDAAVAMAEHIAGSHEAFVDSMNKKARELGMKNTHFINCNGLDDSISSGHYSSARDVAIMSRELIMKHPDVIKYTTIWMDTITHKTKKGETSFGLSNTNKLIRSYDGITGLKTGSTSKAKYCLSATATRGNTSLIAVVMAAKDFKVRFSEAASLLDYGFANCTEYKEDFKNMKPQKVKVKNAINDTVFAVAKAPFTYTLIKDELISDITYKTKMKTNVQAPLKKGDILGEIIFYHKNQEIGSVNLVSEKNIPKATFQSCIKHLLYNLF